MAHRPHADAGDAEASGDAFALAAGARLHYRIEGARDAPVLVLSNSLGTNLAMWDAQMPALVEHFRVLRYDSRGHGRSDVTPGPYAVERLARDVVALLDELDIARAHFCGLSMGGMVGPHRRRAQRWRREHRGRIARALVHTGLPRSLSRHGTEDA